VIGSAYPSTLISGHRQDPSKGIELSSRFRSMMRPARFATATSKLSFARSTATVVVSISVFFWLRGATHDYGNDAAKEPGGVHVITNKEEKAWRSLSRRCWAILKMAG
jgi:hypothetical protein